MQSVYVSMIIQDRIAREKEKRRIFSLILSYSEFKAGEGNSSPAFSFYEVL